MSSWATGGNIPDATIRLQATPATGGAPGFSFGCGKDDGTSSCHLGAVDAKSAQRRFRAQLTVPVTASTVTSVSLTVIGSAAHLAKAAKAAATVSVTAPPASTAAQNPAGVFTPVPVTSPLPVGPLPSIPAASPTLSPGGNAANLFPTLDPKPTRSAAPPAPSGRRAHTLPVADTSALPEGAPVVGAQLAGLAALGLAFALVITRLTVRRRRTATRAKPDTPVATSATKGGDGTPGETPGNPATDGE